MDGVARTQRITQVDIDHGRIRVPIRHKDLFPQSKARLAIRFLGLSMQDIGWDPRLGPDQERSGVLYVGRRAVELVDPDDFLEIQVDDEVIDLRRAP